LCHNFSQFFQVTKFLNRMQLHAKQSTSDNKQCNFIVSVPPTRSDVLHPCDVMEVLAVIHLITHRCISDLLHICFTDKASLFWFCYLQDVAIAYGFNAIKDQAIIDNKGSKRLAASLTLLPLQELSDLIRKEVQNKNIDLVSPLIEAC